MAGEATVQFPLLQPAVDTDARCDPGIDTSYVLDADLLIASTIRKKRKRTESGDLPSPKEVRTAPGLSIPSTPEPNWGLLRPPEQISTEASRRSSFSDIPLPVSCYDDCKYQCLTTCLLGPSTSSATKR